MEGKDGGAGDNDVRNVSEEQGSVLVYGEGYSKSDATQASGKERNVPLIQLRLSSVFIVSIGNGRLVGENKSKV